MKKDRFIVKVQPIENGRTVSISREAYARLEDVKRISGNSLSHIANQAINFAIDRLYIQKEDTD